MNRSRRYMSTINLFIDNALNIDEDKSNRNYVNCDELIKLYKYDDFYLNESLNHL